MVFERDIHGEMATTVGFQDTNATIGVECSNRTATVLYRTSP